MWRIIKWWIALTVIFWLVVIGLFSWYYFSRPGIPNNAILYFGLDENFSDNSKERFADILQGKNNPSLREVTMALRQAAHDPRIKSLVFKVQPLTIGLADIEELDNAMQVWREQKKPSLAFLESAAFEPGDNLTYAAASLADHIILAPPGEIALTAASLEATFFKGTLERLRVGAHISKRYEYKTAGNMFTESGFTKEHKENYAALLKDLQNNWLEFIARRRHVTESQVADWLRHGNYSASEAKEAGLVDEVAYGDEIGQTINERGLDLAEYQAPVAMNLEAAHFALVNLSGIIVSGESNDSPFSESTIGSDTVVEGLRQARKDGVKGVLVRINSPGGSYIASDLIRHELELCQKENLPVITSMGAVAASGGYFIGMQADKVIADASAITGSIGVFSAMFSTRQFWQHWLGVTFDRLSAIPGSEGLSSLDPPNEKQNRQLNASLDRIYDDFTKKVAAARHLSIEQVDKLARGRVWLGKSAQEQGLIDEVGDFHLALRRLKEKVHIDPQSQVLLVPYPAPENWLSQLWNTVRGKPKISLQLKSQNKFLSFILSAEPKVILPIWISEGKR